MLFMLWILLLTVDGHLCKVLSFYIKLEGELNVVVLEVLVRIDVQLKSFGWGFVS